MFSVDPFFENNPTTISLSKVTDLRIVSQPGIMAELAPMAAKTSQRWQSLSATAFASQMPTRESKV